LGIFDGKWDNALPVTFIIFSAKGNKASGLYAWKDYKPWGVSHGCQSFAGAIKGATLTINTGDVITLTSAGARITGTYTFHPGKKDSRVERSNFSRKR
jgi:hypothetical protein